jgi:hypothetical protein
MHKILFAFIGSKYLLTQNPNYNYEKKSTTYVYAVVVANNSGGVWADRDWQGHFCQ